LQPLAKRLAIRDVPPLAGVTQQVNDSLTDVEVVARVLGGDGEAFGILIRRYEPGLLRFAARMLGNADAAADAVAESLVRAYRHLGQCRDPGHLRSWLYRITGNRCRSHLARRHMSDVSLSDVPAPALADEADSWLTLERSEQVALVERALATLPPEKREAFVLKHVEGLSYEEMAQVTGARIPTLKMRVHRAREALVAALGALV
jgi:RNA polymerase sigma-70 factor (ECF subfamily)